MTSPISAFKASLIRSGSRYGVMIISCGLFLCLCITARGQTAKPAKLPALPVNAQGQQAAQYLWDTILSKCDDVWYYRGSELELAEDVLDRGHTIWAYKGVTFQLSRRTVSQAEALNGITWKGVATMKVTAWRKRDDDGKWGSWKNPTDSTDPFSRLDPYQVLVEKVNGEWFYQSAHFLDKYTDIGTTRGQQVSAAKLAPKTKAACNAIENAGALEGKEERRGQLMTPPPPRKVASASSAQPKD